MVDKDGELLRGIEWSKNTFLILGLSVTGLAFAKFLSSKNSRFFVYDRNDKSEHLKQFSDDDELVLGFYQNEESLKQVLSRVNFVLLSPGIPRKSRLVEMIEAAGKSVYLDWELAYEDFLKDKKIVAVTGTDGKTSTTEFIGGILRAGGRNVLCCGNNGVPIFACLEEIEKVDLLVVELSSYMLEDLRYFKSDISLITNVSEDHQDRYPSYDAYAETKGKILDILKPSGVFLWNLDSEDIRFHAREDVEIRKISVDNVFRDDVKYGYFEENFYVFSSDAEGSEVNIENKTAENKKIGKIEREVVKKIKEPNLSKKNRGNKYNLCFALALADIFEMSEEAIEDGLQELKPLEHRLEFVESFGVFDEGRGEEPKSIKLSFYNDSKATTVQSMLGAIKSFEGELVVMILGGKGKGISYDKILEGDLSPLLSVYGYGEVGQEMLDVFKKKGNKKWGAKENGDAEPFVPSSLVLAYEKDFYKALLLAFSWAFSFAKERRVSVNILLSPGATSWDQFRSYEHRGDAFKKAVRAWIFEKTSSKMSEKV